MISPGEQDTEWVRSLVAKAAGIPSESLRDEHRIVHDLQIYGDDAETLMIRFGEHLGLNPATLDWPTFFPPEGFALWLFPKTMRLKKLSAYRPLTVRDLLDCARARKWPD
jgi:hypothetical protein